jgi:hypothetical protein
MTGIDVMATQYRISAIPPEYLEQPDSDAWHWCLYVEYRGAGRWCVTRGGRQCLSRNWAWDWEPSNSSREESWNAEHRFSLEEALERAKRAAPGVTLSGLTAMDVLRLMQERDKASST